MTEEHREILRPRRTEIKRWQPGRPLGSCSSFLTATNGGRARDLFVNALEQIRERHQFLVVGYVVMPDHVHLLIGEPAKGTPSMVLQALKQRVSRDLRKTERDGDLQRFWQPRFYDFNVHSAHKRMEKLDYMHANPVKRGRVKNPAAWVEQLVVLCDGKHRIRPNRSSPVTKFGKRNDEKSHAQHRRMGQPAPALRARWVASHEMHHK